MIAIYVILAASGVSGGPRLDVLQIAPEAKPAVAAYEQCLVEQAVALEPAGESVIETVRVAKHTCVREQTAATRALLGKYYPWNSGPQDVGTQKAVDNVISSYSAAEAKAELAVMTQRARKSRNAPNQ